MLAWVLCIAVSAETDEKFGRVVLAMGQVTAQSGGQAARALRAGDTVYRGEKVSTSEDGRAKLLLEDRSVLTLAPKTEMELTGVRSEIVPKTSVKLLLGRMWANVQKLVGGDPKFDVVTPSAVAGVRGTSFFSEVSGDKSTFSVANGTVLVSVGARSQLLEALQQINANGGTLGGVINLPPGAIADLISALSASSGLSDADRLARLEQLERQLTPQQTQLLDNFRGGVQQIPPVNLDPQQTSQTTLIRGRVEVVNP